jgi:hypothetical protein
MNDTSAGRSGVRRSHHQILPSAKRTFKLRSKDMPRIGFLSYNSSVPQYRRSLVEGGTYFFTVITFNRLPILTGDEARLAALRLDRGLPAIPIRDGGRKMVSAAHPTAIGELKLVRPQALLAAGSVIHSRNKKTSRALLPARCERCAAHHRSAPA